MSQQAKEQVEQGEISKVDPEDGITKKILLVGLAIVLVWLSGWVFGGYQKLSVLEMYSQQPLADTFSSLNALFAGLAFGGVIITIYLQINELRETRNELRRTAEANQVSARANHAMALYTREKSVLDLFQTYCSEYFQTVKNSSMSVLIPCVASKEYCDFVVSRLFVAEQLPFPEHCRDRLEASNAMYGKSFEQFKEDDQFNRYKLDELINFFTILTRQSTSGDVTKRCDFSYSWWRPLFWLLATQQKKRYESSPTIQKYAVNILFEDVAMGMDKTYGLQPFESQAEMWSFILSHPKLISYGIDPAFFQADSRFAEGMAINED